MCATLACRLLPSLCGFLLNLILRLPWRQAAPARTCDLGPLIQETLQLSLLAPFQHQGCGGGATAGSGSSFLPTAAGFRAHPAPQPPVLPPSSRPAHARVNQHQNLQLSRARGERGPRQGMALTPCPCPRLAGQGRACGTPDRGGKTKATRTAACRGAQRGS